MAFSSLFLAFLAIASPVLADFHPANVQAPNVVAGAYILKFDGSPSGLSKRGVDSPAAVLQGVLAGAKHAGIAYEIRHSWTSGGASSIFHGVSIKVGDGVTGEALAALSGVTDVWPVRKFSRPSPITGSGDGGSSTAAKKAAPLSVSSKNEKRSEKLVHRKRASPYATDNFGPHLATGVDKTHAAGNLGAGITVCMLDTGIDYKNPILGGCFGPGCHVALGYDLVGDDYDGTNTPVPDPDPYVSCDEHGTHVSGIVGALANSLGFSGVAPLATLGMYRVFGCTPDGTVDDDVLLAAYLRAVGDGCNVINMSLAGPSPFTSSDAVEVAMDQAAARGVATAVAAGNAGDEGLFFASSPSSSLTGYAVGSTAGKILTAYNATLSGSPGLPFITYLTASPITLSKTYRVYFTSTDPSVTDDACDPLPASTPNLQNYVVVVQRGSCAFATKTANIAAAGGTVALIYNSPNGADNLYQVPEYKGTLLAASGMRRADGLALLAAYMKASRLLVRFQATTSFSVPNALDAGLMSAFSEFGPTADLYSAVTLSAPGEDILSTFPLALDAAGVGIISGTSMATPFIAGSIAVVMAARSAEKLTVAQVKGLLVNTAQFVPTTPGGTTWTTGAQQGAGIVQVDAAIAAKTFITPSQIFLNDSTHSAYSQSIKLKNTNSYSVFYIISTDVAQTVSVYSVDNNILPALEPVPVISASGTVKLQKTRVQVAAGASMTVSFTFVPPAVSASDAQLFPVFSGWITVTEQALIASPPPNVIYHVPYLGMLGSLFNMPVFDTTDAVHDGTPYPFIVDSNFNVQTGTKAYTSANPPTLYFRLAGASPVVTVDLVASTSNYPATIRASSNTAAATSRLLHSDVPVVANLYYLPYAARDNLVDNPTNGYTETTLEYDGQGAVSGKNYRILLRALKNTGDPLYEDQYESWLSPIFSFTS